MPAAEKFCQSSEDLHHSDVLLNYKFVYLIIGILPYIFLYILDIFKSPQI